MPSHSRTPKPSVQGSGPWADGLGAPGRSRGLLKGSRGRVPWQVQGSALVAEGLRLRVFPVFSCMKALTERALGCIIIRNITNYS